MLRLWRNKPLCENGSTGDKLLHERYVFPSARQALSSALEQAGLGRADRIALPEWSSHCVISAAGKIATPLPLREVLEHNIPVLAALLYEQWGWPFSNAVHRQVRSRFGDAIIVLDCVDSADIEQINRLDHYQDADDTVFVVYSLSKLLGLKGGGIARTRSGYLEFLSTSPARTLDKLLWQSAAVNEIFHDLLHMHKTDIQCVHHSVLSWMKTHDILHSLSVEANKRRYNLSVIAGSAMANNWPRWMHDAIVAGAAPGIVPLGYGRTLPALQALGKCLLAKYGIETSIYNFNWSGNPLAAEYSQCLAFPVHGEVNMQLLQDIIADETTQ